MDTHAKLVALALLFLSGSASAGYAYPSSPAGFSGTGASMAYKAAAADTVSSGVIRSASSAVLNVGGRSVTMPVAYRFAANAGQVAARAAFLNPALFVGIAAGTALYSWYNDSGFTVSGGAWVKPDPNVCSTSPCYSYTVNFNTVHLGPFSTKASACAANIDYGSTHFRNGHPYDPANPLDSICLYDVYSGSTLVYTNDSRDTLGITQVAPSAPSYFSVSQSEFESALSSKPIPEGLPQKLPDPLPVELPIINPSADPSPLAQPMRIPSGEPQPVPNSNPQQWKVPVVDVVPSPTSSSPFRVDVQPKDVIKEDATPLPESAPVPTTPPAGQTDAPVTPDLCEKNPEILACQKINLGSVDAVPVPNDNRSMSITPDTGWGASNAGCPAPRSVNLVSGYTVTMPFDLLCQFAAGIRPVVIALAWLTAALGFIGFARRD